MNERGRNVSTQNEYFPTKAIIATALTTGPSAKNHAAHSLSPRGRGLGRGGQENQAAVEATKSTGKRHLISGLRPMLYTNNLAFPIAIEIDAADR